MREHLLQWLSSHGYSHSDLVVNIVMIGLFSRLSARFYPLRPFPAFFSKRLQASKLLFLNILSQQKLFSNLGGLTIPGRVAGGAAAHLAAGERMARRLDYAHQYLLIWCFGLLAIFALLDTLQTYLFRRDLAQHFPVRARANH